MKSSRSAFTLVELLAGVGIIIVLATLAFAGIAKAARTARGTQCLNNLRQIGAASFAYAAENDGLLPQSSHQGPAVAWTTVLKRSVPAKTFRSPLDDVRRPTSYAINDFLTEHPFGAGQLNFSRLQSIDRPSRTLFFALANPSQRNSDHFHFAEEGHSPSSFNAEVWVNALHDSGHYLFLDGHVARLDRREVNALLTDPASGFIRPDGDNSQP